jgi:hypothetical protein
MARFHLLSLFAKMHLHLESSMVSLGILTLELIRKGFFFSIYSEPSCPVLTVPGPVCLVPEYSPGQEGSSSLLREQYYFLIKGTLHTNSSQQGQGSLLGPLQFSATITMGGSDLLWPWNKDAKWLNIPTSLRIVSVRHAPKSGPWFHSWALLCRWSH